MLDLRVPELRIEPFNDALRRVGVRPVPADQVQMCSDADAPIRNQVYAVLVMAGEEKAWLGLDTGASRTSIVVGSPLIRGLQLEPGGETMGVAGSSLRRNPHAGPRCIRLRGIWRYRLPVLARPWMPKSSRRRLADAGQVDILVVTRWAGALSCLAENPSRLPAMMREAGLEGRLRRYGLLPSSLKCNTDEVF